MRRWRLLLRDWKSRPAGTKSVHPLRGYPADLGLAEPAKAGFVAADPDFNPGHKGFSCILFAATFLLAGCQGGRASHSSGGAGPAKGGGAAAVQFVDMTEQAGVRWRHVT